MRIAGNVTVAVVDLDQLAITLPRPRPDHDAGRDGDDLRPGPGRKIDALVERAPARKRIVTGAEARGDVADGYWPPLGVHLVAELAVGQQLLEHAELAGPVGELLVEGVERADDTGKLRKLGIGKRLLGTAEGGIGG